MTVTEILLACSHTGIVLSPAGDSLDVDAPVSALTPALREALAARKPDLLSVLRRLDGMRRTLGRVPIPCAVLKAVGGPGRCFSCGDALSHRDACGRCEPCNVACELFYRECPTASAQWRQTP